LVIYLSASTNLHYPVPKLLSCAEYVHFYETNKDKYHPHKVHFKEQSNSENHSQTTF